MAIWFVVENFDYALVELVRYVKFGSVYYVWVIPLREAYRSLEFKSTSKDYLTAAGPYQENPITKFEF